MVKQEVKIFLMIDTKVVQGGYRPAQAARIERSLGIKEGQKLGIPYNTKREKKSVGRVKELLGTFGFTD